LTRLEVIDALETQVQELHTDSELEAIYTVIFILRRLAGYLDCLECGTWFLPTITASHVCPACR